MIKISVVIPTYQRPHLLKKCLLALAEQNFLDTEFEVLVVSDGPDEPTKQLVNDFSSTYQQFVFKQTQFKKGPAAARNLGWKQANGILVAFTDDDTLPDKNWLTEFWTAYKGEKEIAYSGQIKVPVSDRPTDYEKNAAGLETAEFVTANCCCTKAALERVGGFDERFSMAWREDSDLEFQLMLHGISIVHLPAAVVVHPVRPAPWGVSVREQKKGMFNALLYKKYPELYRKKIQPSPLWNYYLMVIAALLCIISMAAGITWLGLFSFTVWLFLLVAFVYRRLQHTSKRFDHILEMIFTSIAIPFVSVYWQLYGATRYKVFFL
jgi:GT2 family glycosyltransferase